MLRATYQYCLAIVKESEWLKQFYGKFCEVAFLNGTFYRIFISNTAPWIEGFYGEIEKKGTEHYKFSNESIQSITIIN